MKKYTLITGGSSGIGYEFAKLFAQDNHNLILVAQDLKKLKEKQRELKKQFNVDIIIIDKDLSLQKNILSLFKETEAYEIDYLINNAGFATWGNFLDLDWKREAQMIDLNVKTLSQLAYHYANKMKTLKCGFILNVASLAAIVPSGPYMANYFATKSFVLSLSQALSFELKKFNIRVTALCPPGTKTGFFDRANMNTSPMLTKSKVFSAEKIAKKGYIGLIKGKSVVKPNFRVKLIDFLSRIFPRNTVTKMAANVAGNPDKFKH